MNTQALLTNLSQRGIHLTAENGYLCIDAPKAVVDEDLKRVIAANKARLLAALNPKIEVDSGLPFKPCPRCNHGHFWLSSGWQCSDCYPMPDGIFMGETCTVDSPNPHAAQSAFTTSRAKPARSTASAAARWTRLQG